MSHYPSDDSASARAACRFSVAIAWSCADWIQPYSSGSSTHLSSISRIWNDRPCQPVGVGSMFSSAIMNANAVGRVSAFLDSASSMRRLTSPSWRRVRVASRPVPLAQAFIAPLRLLMSCCLSGRRLLRASSSLRAVSRSSCFLISLRFNQAIHSVPSAASAETVIAIQSAIVGSPIACTTLSRRHATSYGLQSMRQQRTGCAAPCTIGGRARCALHAFACRP